MICAEDMVKNPNEMGVTMNTRFPKNVFMAIAVLSMTMASNGWAAAGFSNGEFAISSDDGNFRFNPGVYLKFVKSLRFPGGGAVHERAFGFDKARLSAEGHAFTKD